MQCADGMRARACGESVASGICKKKSHKTIMCAYPAVRCGA